MVGSFMRSPGRGEGASTRAHDRLEQEKATGRPEQGFRGSLRVRHQAEDVSPFVADASDIVEGPIGVCSIGSLPARCRTAQDALALLVELPQGFRVGVIAPLVVIDRHTENLTRAARGGEGCRRVLDADVDMAADEGKARVSEGGPRPEAR